MKTTLLAAAAAIGCLGLSACSGTPVQNPALSNSLTGPTALDSGITSSNGGGQRAVGGTPGVNIGSGGTSGGLQPATKGNSY